VFFNYLIMGFTIQQVPRVGFIKSKGDFGYIAPIDNYIESFDEEKFAEEIRLIKKLPLEERRAWFKKG